LNHFNADDDSILNFSTIGWALSKETLVKSEKKWNFSLQREQVCLINEIPEENATWVFVRSEKDCGFVASFFLKPVSDCAGVCLKPRSKGRISRIILKLPKKKKRIESLVNVYCVPNFISQGFDFVETNCQNSKFPYRKSTSHQKIDQIKAILVLLTKV